MRLIDGAEEFDENGLNNNNNDDDGDDDDDHGGVFEEAKGGAEIDLLMEGIGERNQS